MIEQQEEISLKDVILKIHEYFHEVLRSWKLIFLFALLLSVFFGVRNFLALEEFEARCTFMLNDATGSANAGISSILGQFGLGGGREFKLEKIAELTRSRVMTAEVMFQPTRLEGREDYLANFYIEEKRKYEQWTPHYFWQTPGPLADYAFEHDSMAVFTRLDNAALINLNRRFNEDLQTEIDDATGILTFRLKTTNEDLGVDVLSRLFERVSGYYTEKSVEKQRATFEVLDEKCDSLESVLHSKEYALARYRDTYQGRWLQTEEVEETKLYREIRMLTVMYAEALKNKELAAFSLENMTPFIQGIDLPILPLNSLKGPLWMAMIKGLVLGMGLGMIFVVLRKLYREIMLENDGGYRMGNGRG